MFTVHLVAKPMVLSCHFDRSIQFIKGVYFFILNIKAVAIGRSWLMFTFVLWGYVLKVVMSLMGKPVT